MVDENTPTVDRLLGLLPAVYRIRDAENEGLLRELLEVIGDQVDVLSEDLAQFYDDLFIETSAPWVAPYLGDLVGYRVLHGVTPEVASPRSEVANTVAYRRRKGTAAVLEQLARDVTGSPARVVEFFERLATTQYMNHPRPGALATVSVRNEEALAWIGRDNAAFDDHAHTANVRRITAEQPHRAGRHNIHNVGIFLWRTEAIPVARSPLVHHADGRRFRFDPSGADTPLFGMPLREPEISHLAGPLDVPLALGRRWLRDHRGAYYGASTGSVRRSLLVERQAAGGDITPVPLAEVNFGDLSDLPSGDWAHEPAAGLVVIDPVLGRVFLGTALAAGERLLGTFATGMAVPVGAGNSRRVSRVSPSPRSDAEDGQNLQSRLDAVSGGGTVRIVDNDRYPQSLTVRATTAAAGDPPTEVWLTAADHTRPHVELATALTFELAPHTTAVLDGLLISGGPLVLDEVGDTERRDIVIRNCTLVPGHSRSSAGLPVHPGRASLIVLDPFARVRIEASVVGSIIAVEGARIVVVDSVIDGSDRTAVAITGRAEGATPRKVETVADMELGAFGEPAGDIDLNETTVIGGIHCVRLDTSNSLLVATLAPGDLRPAAILARRRQVGCVRYSFVPEGSRTGRRFQCAPDPALAPAQRLAVRPRFTSLGFGDPGYVQLSVSADPAIRNGADDEGEMGATHRLFTPLRERNLRVRLDEYLRLGLDAAWIYAS